MRRLQIFPEQHGIIIALRSFLEKRIMVKADIARLKIRISSSCPSRYHLHRAERDDNPVDIRQLAAF
ncbi:hypothetical protein MnTg02_02701 [bacterium MnTg02]|nr:hypothetical protein MnTg02_02701 [bacterium MnTg02]